MEMETEFEGQSEESDLESAANKAEAEAENENLSEADIYQKELLDTLDVIGEKFIAAEGEMIDEIQKRFLPIVLDKLRQAGLNE